MSCKPCESCKAFAAEVVVPDGDGCVDLCWICAHDVTHHDREIGEVVGACTCPITDIYPEHVLARRSSMGIEPAITEVPKPRAADYKVLPEYIGRRSRRSEELRIARVARLELHRARKDASEN